MTNGGSQEQAKNNSCSNCGSENTVEITYGYVDTVQVIYDGSDADGPYFGGCSVDEDSPTQHCYACGTDFGYYKTV